MRIRQEIEWLRSRDPAAPGLFLTAVISPGLHAVWMHRVYSRLCRRRASRILGRLVYRSTVLLTRVDLHPNAIIGSPIAIDHGLDVVVGGDAVVGDRVLVYQGARVGVDGGLNGRITVVGSDCMIGAGAVIERGVVIGDGASIGANAFVRTDVPAGMTAVGVPARVRAGGNPSSRLGASNIDPSLLI